MNVKVCNLRSNDFSQEFFRSMLDTGFAVITHHGIDFGLIRDTQSAWKEFFCQNRGYKDLYVNEKDPNLGFIGFGGERAVGAEVADLKEFFHWRPGHYIPTEVADLTYKLFSLLEGDIAGQLLHSLNGNGLASPFDFAEACRNSDNTILRALYYPALRDVKVQPGAVRSAEHQDINFLTLLVAASAPGLQVKDNRDGSWHEVPFEENSIVCNLGDMLQLATNRAFVSTTHRVVNPDNSRTDRLSIPLFVHPKGDTVLASGFTAQQYLAQRISEIYQRVNK